MRADVLALNDGDINVTGGYMLGGSYKQLVISSEARNLRGKIHRFALNDGDMDGAG